MTEEMFYISVVIPASKLHEVIKSLAGYTVEVSAVDDSFIKPKTPEEKRDIVLAMLPCRSMDVVKAIGSKNPTAFMNRMVELGLAKRGNGMWEPA